MKTTRPTTAAGSRAIANLVSFARLYQREALHACRWDDKSRHRAQRDAYLHAARIASAALFRTRPESRHSSVILARLRATWP